MTAAGPALTRLPWREPVAAFAPFAEEAYALLLLSAGATGGRWSFIARAPRATDQVSAGEPDRDFARLRGMLGACRRAAADGPPFQGGVVGLAAYEFAARLEPVSLARDPAWPDLTLARYDHLLAFDHRKGVVIAVGEAAGWLDASAPKARRRGRLAADFGPESAGEAYEAAVCEVKERVAGGEIFQANIARAWSGRLGSGAAPFDVFTRLQAVSPAPFCAYWRLPGRALVSHSPERFVSIASDAVTVETRPIKGTRPRGADGDEDRGLRRELCASAKDRAENLMIVDLMRNDLARVCRPGSVRVTGLCELETFVSVHHLVSTVTGRLETGLGAADLLAATFPPGSITGAPKVQAMKVIAGHEGPRGPWCGSLFWAGYDGAFDSSVLIRTGAFVEEEAGWRFRVLAGAGIVADSDPGSERAETEAKIAGFVRALTGRA